MNRSSQHVADELLVLRWQSGDRVALEILFSRWNRRLWRHAVRLTERPEAASDVMQDAWLSMVQWIHRLQDPACFRRWAYQIVTRRAADWIRIQQRNRQADQLAAQDSTNGSSMKPPIDDDLDQEENRAVRAALRQLPPHNRLILAMFYVDELSVKEISHALSIPEGTVKSRLYHSRQQLKQILERSMS